MQIFKEQSHTDANPVSAQAEVIPVPRQADVEPGQAQQPVPPPVPPPLPETEPPPVPTPEPVAVPNPEPVPELVPVPVPGQAQVISGPAQVPTPVPEPTPEPVVVPELVPVLVSGQARTRPPVPPPIEETYPPQEEKPLVPNLTLIPDIYALQDRPLSYRNIDINNPQTRIENEPNVINTEPSQMEYLKPSKVPFGEPDPNQKTVIN